MNKHFSRSWSSSGEHLKQKASFPFFFLPTRWHQSEGGCSTPKSSRSEFSTEDTVEGLDGPLTLGSICHSLTLKLTGCLTQQRDELKQGNTDSPLWILTFRDFSSCCFTLIRTQPAKVALKSENSECCLCFRTVAEGLLRLRHKPQRTSRAVKPTLCIWTHWAPWFILGAFAFLQTGIRQTYLPRSFPLECTLLLCPSVRWHSLGLTGGLRCTPRWLC